MRREHPLRILRYSMKNLWLLIFPIVRGAYHFASREDIEAWLRGTWFELLILLAIFGYGFLNWYFREFGIVKEQLYVRDGILFTRQRFLPIRNLSVMAVEQPVWLRPFGGEYLYADAAGGLLEATDIKLLIRRRDEKLFLSAIPRLRQGKRHHFSDRVGIWRTLLFSMIFSSSFSGALYLAVFWFQGGRIARDLLHEFQVTERLNSISATLAGRLMGIPPAAVALGILILSTWLLSFLANLIRYGGFRMESDKRMIAVNSGLVTRRHFYLSGRKVNYIDIRQNVLTKLCRIFSLAVNCPGYGSMQGAIPICMPILTRRELEETMPMIFPGSRLSRNKLRPPWHSWWGYICIPFLTAAAVIPASSVLLRLFPAFDDVIRYFIIMIEIPIIWKTIVQFIAFTTTGISISRNHACIRYCKGLTFHTIICDVNRIVKVRIHRHFWHHLTGKCHVLLYFRSESPRHCTLIGMQYSEVKEQLKEFL
ncbi:MAG: PH domain-containing protein [Oscillospiraceae bacterium]|nr:PH domain-containing protein [Oscillospiraceae bacterium]